MLEELRVLAIEAARAAAAVHASRNAGGLEVSSKSDSADLVTRIDREAEAALVRLISSSRPNDAIVSEEGTDRAGTSGVTWILDPLDGTTNLVHGYPHHAVAVGVLIGNVRKLGVVLDSANDRLNVGAVGQGASRDGKALAASSRRELKAALVGTGFLPSDRVRLLQAEVLKAVLPRVRDIRRSGSAALDLCAVAEGWLDAYYEFGIGRWDLTAGAAIAEAAGATVVELDPGILPGPLVIAGNERIVEDLAEVILASVRRLGAG